MNDNFAKKLVVKQQGFALLMLVFVLMVAGLAGFMNYLNGANVKIERDKKTAASLAEAKAALIGYSVSHISKPGTFPCPDTNGDGSGDSKGNYACQSYIGWLPVKQLGISALRDGDDECLWYALSPKFRNAMKDTDRKDNPINAGVGGTISLFDDIGLVIDDTVIAVLIAPRAPLVGQSRTKDLTKLCPGDFVSSNYLESKDGIDNSTGNVAGENYSFKLGKLTPFFNDQINYVKAGEVHRPLKVRMLKEILGNVDPQSGLVKYYSSADPPKGYPCPSSVAEGAEERAPDKSCLIKKGFVPFQSPDLQYARLGGWLIDNKWFELSTYDYISFDDVKVSIVDRYGSYSCESIKNIFSCDLLK